MTIAIIAIVVSALGALIALLSWRDKRIFARNAELDKRFEAIRQDLEHLETRVHEHEAELRVLNVRVETVEQSKAILESISHKIDELQKSL